MSEYKNLKFDVERSEFRAMMGEKCPQCRQGNMFKYPLWRVDKFDKMNENCPVCNLRFEVEPGFWYGAMFVSYGFSILLLILLGVVIYWFFNDPPVMGYVVPITIISLLAVPVNFRISRSVFLHLFGFVKYKADLR
ncbi:Protein of unknown function [Pseudarcicella hirudinis]|uniref:DUF983 domain-containing protein n=1 Tax=Pseudarcicella hirudinis TaxID=1079859 RepID=A0A1I5P9P4_9BACT|nr:DUF983 domain-containing protein [Pseudarcicella hirudinis]SFP30829.1 Protein of unknown function [Pseudarcicella hirudinis]